MGNYFANFGNWDWVIVFFFAINVVFGCISRYNAWKIERHFNPTSYLYNANEASKNALKNYTSEKKILSEDELIETYKRQNIFYALFVNVTSCMPLLGMLGTVVGLLDSSNKLDTGFSGSFFIALTTTLTGIVCSIFFKVADAFISPVLDRNEKYMDFLFNPNRK